MHNTARILIALLALESAPSLATVIGFETTSGVGNPNLLVYGENAYYFTSSEDMQLTGEPTLCPFGGCVTSPTGQYLAVTSLSFTNVPNASVGITLKSTTGPFTLRSFDTAGLFLNDSAASGGGLPSATFLVVEGRKTSASGFQFVAVIFGLDGIKDGAGGLNDFQTFFLPSSFEGVDEVTFYGRNDTGRGLFAIDNVDTTAPVPEPASWALFLLGMTSLWYFRKRSTKA